MGINKGKEMKLTKYIKREIYNAILKDLPDYINYREQAQSAVWVDSTNQLPVEIKEAIKINPDVKNYIGVASNYIAECGCMSLWSYIHYKMSEDTRTEVNRIHLLIEEQDTKRRDIKANLWALIDACTTMESFMKNYPEFNNYVPKEDQPTINLPAVQLLNEMKNIGWGKK